MNKISRQLINIAKQLYQYYPNEDYDSGSQYDEDVIQQLLKDAKSSDINTKDQAIRSLYILIKDKRIKNIQKLHMAINWLIQYGDAHQLETIFPLVDTDVKIKILQVFKEKNIQYTLTLDN